MVGHGRAAWALAFLVGVAGCASAPGAEPVTDNSARTILTIVMETRLSRFGDDTVFLACELFTELGEPEGLPQSVPFFRPEMVERKSAPCAADPPPSSWVRIEELRIDGNEAQVTAMVSRPGGWHREEYDFYVNAGSWVLRSVTAHSFLSR